MAADGTQRLHTQISWPQGLASEAMRGKIAAARVLAVGAGGIGCELLKTLVLTGFRNIEVIDLDTIDISNLNRQFLFRKKHVGQSKSTVAVEAVKRLRPSLNVVARQGNIKEPHYGLDFFRRFDLVVNGLDNLEARQHVNKMCVHAGIPLVESGTAGYLGQVSVHVGGRTECFDCQPKPVPKSFPSCTIRSFPEKPVHCIVWVKDLLFPCLFGETEGESDIDAVGGLRRAEGESAVDYSTRIFSTIFTKNIAKMIEVTFDNNKEDVWQGRRPPEPLNLESLRDGAPGVVAPAASTACSLLGLDNPNAAWTPKESTAVFLESIQRMVEERPNEIGSLVFDKDDDLAMEFVTAAANLRSLCYHIPPQSLFDAKGMAGNIIHAIATTNAIISGLIVVEALKLLAAGGDPASCKTSFLRQDLSNKKLITPTTLEAPNPSCMACGLARLELRLDIAAFTFGDFVTKILRGYLGLSEFIVFIGNSIIYEESEDLEEDEVELNALQLLKDLADLPAGGIGHSSFITIRDEANQSRDITAMICHQDIWDEEKYPHRFAVIGKLPEPVVVKAVGACEVQATTTDGAAAEFQPKSGKTIALEAADGSFVIMDSEDEGPAVAAGAAKRKIGADEDDGSTFVGGKRAKQEATTHEYNDDDVIELD